MVTVFISYETTTGLEFSKHLQKSLLKHNIASFVAKEDIAPGKASSKLIQKNLKDCKYFVLILTINAFKSSEVKREFSLAKEWDKYIIPCVKEGLEEYIEKDFEEIIDYQHLLFKTKEDLANCVLETILKQRIIEDKNTIRSIKSVTRQDVIDSLLDDWVMLETNLHIVLTEPEYDPNRGGIVIRMKIEDMEKRKKELLNKFKKEIIDSGGTIIE
ncbi:MAG: toll/interleukin-1 receptor domain-containing protein [Candidatus Bathyarchaeota archaeon]|nr:toll/interleukin-1 receptor domain-containing protein [Candidatus Bathyarchaeum tardum]